jgi:hypothetical protein
MIGLKHAPNFGSGPELKISKPKAHPHILLPLKLQIPINQTIKIHNQHHPLLLGHIQPKIEHLLTLSLEFLLIQIGADNFIFPIGKGIG